MGFKRQIDSWELEGSMERSDPSELPSMQLSMQLSSSDIRALIDFFVLLDKWDTLQSTHKPGETRPCSEDAAA